MSISLIPPLVVRTTVRRDMMRMSEDLAQRSENILVHKASTGLQRIVAEERAGQTGTGHWMVPELKERVNLKN